MEATKEDPVKTLEELLAIAENDLNVKSHQIEQMQLHISNIEYQLSGSKENLITLMKDRNVIEETLSKVRRQLADAKPPVAEVPIVKDEKMEKVMQGLPYEWQRIIVNLMSRHPGEKFHFRDNLVKALVKDKVQVIRVQAIDGSVEVLVDNRRATAVLNLLGYLRDEGVVTMLKGGFYCWGKPNKAPPMPFTNVKPILVPQPPEAVAAWNHKMDVAMGGDSYQRTALFHAQAIYDKVFGIREAWNQKNLEREFHQKMVEAGVSFAHDYERDAQLIERYLYERAQPKMGLQVWEKKFRQGNEEPTIIIMNVGLPPMPTEGWKRVEYPAYKQESKSTKRASKR